MSNEPILVRPAMQYKDSFIAAVREYEREGVRPPWNYSILQDQFDEYIDTVLAAETQPLAGYVPQSTFWLVVNKQYAGTLDIRHHLTPSLRKFGGHIGYRVRPTMRRKGYGTLQLKLALPHIWALGIERALVTCDDDNVGSQKIIEANAGILQDKLDNGRSSLTRRYWIDKPKSSN
ncbi:MAG: GNAT family N-acetyltransferase [Chloroflexota bacterium]